MDSQDMVVDSLRVQRLNFSVEQVKPIDTPDLQEAPSPARLRVQFLYITQHRILVSTSSTWSIDSLPSSLQETGWPTVIHDYEDAGKKLCGEFDLNVLLSKVDELGANFSPLLSQFRIEQGSEEHARIVGEVKRVGMGIGPERKNQGLFSLQVSIVRVLTTYHRCKRNFTEPVVKGEEIMVWVIGAERRRVRVPGEDKCSVCLETFRIRSCVSMPCSHVFHTKCLETWLQGRNKRSCPLCRSEMPTRVGPSPIADMYHVGFILS
ncbi:hypothetical protein ACLB2K_046756 [Fragaria x ananassa]